MSHYDPIDASARARMERLTPWRRRLVFFLRAVAFFLLLEGIWEACWPHLRLRAHTEAYRFLAKIYASIAPVGPRVDLVWTRLGAKTLAAAAFFSPGDPLHWATPGGQIGLAAGAAILTVCLLLPAGAHGMLAGMALLVGTALVNLAPENPFLPSDAALIQRGQLLNFHGLTQLTASLWPFITFAYLGLLGAARDPMRRRGD